jgi:hypothetical protein
LFGIAVAFKEKKGLPVLMDLLDLWALQVLLAIKVFKDPLVRLDLSAPVALKGLEGSKVTRVSKGWPRGSQRISISHSMIRHFPLIKI